MKERNLLLEDSSYMALLMRFREKSCGRTTRANSRFVDEFPRFTFVELRSVPYTHTHLGANAKFMQVGMCVACRAARAEQQYSTVQYRTENSLHNRRNALRNRVLYGTRVIYLYSFV